jgi:hypothetical protein
VTGWQDEKQRNLLFLFLSSFCLKKQEVWKKTGLFVLHVNVLSSGQQKKTLQITTSRPPLSAATVIWKATNG